MENSDNKEKQPSTLARLLKELLILAAIIFASYSIYTSVHSDKKDVANADSTAVKTVDSAAVAKATVVDTAKAATAADTTKKK